MTDEADEPETAIALMTLALAGVTIGIMVLIFAAHPAEGASVCLTKKEARHLWPRKHIWWYRDKQTGDHCWSNRRGPPRGLKFDPVDPVFPKRAMAKVPDEPKAADTDNCCWPQLDRDANANIIEAPRSFIDRWQDQPWLGRIGQ
jgi:hypothetical protein